jgi:hypothetical protein
MMSLDEKDFGESISIVIRPDSILISSLTDETLSRYCEGTNPIKTPFSVTDFYGNTDDITGENNGGLQGYLRGYAFALDLEDRKPPIGLMMQKNDTLVEKIYELFGIENREVVGGHKIGMYPTSDVFPLPYVEGFADALGVKVTSGDNGALMYEGESESAIRVKQCLEGIAEDLELVIAYKEAKELDPNYSPDFKIINALGCVGSTKLGGCYK